MKVTVTMENTCDEFERDDDGCLWDVRQVDTFESAKLLCEQAGSLYAEWSYAQKVRFQLFQHRLCMPFNLFHEALGKHFGRPVFTHELAFGYKGLQEEFLGINGAPSFDEIVDLIPEERRILISQ